MKTALLVVNDENLHSVSVFKRILGDLGTELKCRAVFSGNPGAADLILNRRHGMDYDDSDLDLLEKLNCPVLNPVQAQRVCRDKWAQYEWLRDRRYPVCPTWRVEDWSLCQEEEKEKGAWVLKTQRGMQGRGVSFHPSSARLTEAIHKNGDDKRYIVQRKLRFARELRSCHIGEDVFFFEKLGGGNIFSGAQAFEIFDVDPLLVGMARNIQKGLGLKLCAFDFLIADQIYPIDLNCYPGLRLVENKTEALTSLFKSMLS